MNVKLLSSVWVTGSWTCLVRSKSNYLNYASRFCSSKSSDDRESELKKLLNDSSPLQPTPEAENFWATSPYVKGTVFKSLEPDLKEEEPFVDHSIIMFPGQGNQFVGMNKNLMKYPTVKEMFAAASDILNYDLLDVCENGPENKLSQTEYCQPATLVCSLAALEKLKEEKPWAINNCVGTCGYSLGEFSALVFAGCLTFEKGHGKFAKYHNWICITDGDTCRNYKLQEFLLKSCKNFSAFVATVMTVHLVHLRAKAMSLCCQTVDSGMLTVLYGPKADIPKAMADAIQHCHEKGVENPVCSVASYLFPNCKVIGGNIEALNFLIENSKKYHFRRLSKLPVSGAFHTTLMKEAADLFKEQLQAFEIKNPLIKVYSNVSGKVYANNKDIRKKLPKQIYYPVKWEQTMHSVFERPKGSVFPFAYECGPGDSLSVVLKKINISASVRCYALQL